MKTAPSDILEVLEIYKKRLAKFEREMAALGIRVKVQASLGPWTSTVEAVRTPSVKIRERWILCLKSGRWTLFIGFGEVQERGAHDEEK